jgi:type IV pilus assembly protein PilB
VEGFNQIQVNPAKDVTFANGLRSILRQDPDIISVGEIRDQDTAEIAFRAAMTGHLVFSTIHTINAIATISRLMEIGLEPYLIASSLILVIAQRLVKRVCPACKETYIPDEILLEKFHDYIRRSQIKEFYHGIGCQECGYTGFSGRTAIFEILPVTHELRELIIKRASESDMMTEARRTGFKSLAESGMVKVARGSTTIEEVSRIADFLDITTAAAIMDEKRHRKKVVIADDDEYLLKLLDMYLTKAGYDVLKVRDGEELLAVVARDKPDLVVTDVTMPKMDGLQATKVLKSKIETAVIPVMMLTAREDKESELIGIDAGADDYLSKPFDYDKFLARVRMLLRRQAV